MSDLKNVKVFALSDHVLHGNGEQLLQLLQQAKSLQHFRLAALGMWWNNPQPSAFLGQVRSWGEHAGTEVEISNELADD